MIQSLDKAFLVQINEKINKLDYLFGISALCLTFPITSEGRKYLIWTHNMCCSLFKRLMIQVGNLEKITSTE